MFRLRRSDCRLKAVHALLVVPKTRDCVDILLSGENLKELKRPQDGFFLSHGWMEYMKNSRLDLNRIWQRKVRSYRGIYEDHVPGL